VPRHRLLSCSDGQALMVQSSAIRPSGWDWSMRLHVKYAHRLAVCKAYHIGWGKGMIALSANFAVRDKGSGLALADHPTS
jgi:hypothetical protein